MSESDWNIVDQDVKPECNTMLFFSEVNLASLTKVISVIARKIHV